MASGSLPAIAPARRAPWPSCCTRASRRRCWRRRAAFDAWAVGVVMNISSDHLGMGGISTLEELARVKQVVVEAVRRDGAAVLNLEDPLVAEMAAATDAEVVYFGRDPRQHMLAAHLAAAGRGVY